MIKITFPDGNVREYESGVTGLQIAESISQRLAQDVLACGVNGETDGDQVLCQPKRRLLHAGEA